MLKRTKEAKLSPLPTASRDSEVDPEQCPHLLHGLLQRTSEPSGDTSSGYTLNTDTAYVCPCGLTQTGRHSLAFSFSNGIDGSVYPR